GAGAGHLGEYLTREFPRARFCFVEALQMLRERLRWRFGDQADFSGRPSFAGTQFITLLDVLEHQADDLGFLADLVRKMESGASLLISVPAVPYLWSAWDEGLGHYRRYTRQSLRGVLEKAGLEVAELSYLFPELVPLAFYRRLRSPRFAASSSSLDHPTLPGPINQSLYLIGLASYSLRRFHLVGTSLWSVARKK